MTLLCELTDKYAKQQYFKAFGRDTEKDIPLIFGHQLYVFLYEYFSENDDNVKFIEIIKPDDTNLERLFSSKLKEYSTDITAYEDPFDMQHWFDELKFDNRERLIKITNLIRNARFVENGLLQDGTYLLYLPLSYQIISELILNHDKRKFTIYTSGKQARLFNDGIIKLETSSVKSIYQKLIPLKENCKKVFNENIGAAKNYSSSKYIENFNNSFQEKLKRFRVSRNKKEYYFFGSDSYTAKEGINYFLGSSNYREYDLFDNPKYLRGGNKDYVFLNFHHLYNKGKQNDLADLIREEKPQNHLVIQGDNQHMISFFEKYKKIEVPDEKDIKSVISGLFISLLISEHKYRGSKGYLYPFVEHKLLNDILSETSFPQALLMAINDIDEITEEDLLYNVSFWGALLGRYSEELKEINKDKIVVPPKEEWVFDITSEHFSIYSPHGAIDRENILKFIPQLLLLILYTQIYDKPMSVITLRKAIIKLDGEPMPEVITKEQARIACRKNFTALKESNDLLKLFYESFVEYNVYKFHFDLRSVELKISGFKVPEGFFEDLI